MFDKDGNDNGLTTVIEDQLDYHNIFTGGYDFGDFHFKRLYSVNQAHNIYWKKTKNPANKQLPHLEDCVFLNDPNDPNGLIRLLMPGGNAVFKMKNVFFGGARQSGGEGVIMAPQHCGLYSDNQAALSCNMHYDLNNVDFQIGQNGQILTFGASGGSETAPVFISKDSSLHGHHFVMSSKYNGFEKVDGCRRVTNDHKYVDIACDNQNVKLGRLLIWTSGQEASDHRDMGMIKLNGKGFEVEPNWSGKLNGINAGYLAHDCYDWPKQDYSCGYGSHVLLGERYEIRDMKNVGEVYFELFDLYPERSASETIRLNLCMGNNCRECVLRSDDDRTWHAHSGIDKRAPLNECGQVFKNLRSIPAI